MAENTTCIQTTHVGSLPRSERLQKANRQRQEGTLAEIDFQKILAEEVQNVVTQQVEVGIDIVNDGEYGHAMAQAVDYGAWWHYSFARTGGLELIEEGNPVNEVFRSTPGNLKYTTFGDRRDWTKFHDFYATELDLGNDPDRSFPVATSAISYVGQDAVASDTANLNTAIQAVGAQEGFVAALSPGSAARVGNKHYASDKEFIFAWADVLKEEYKAIIDAGLTVQIDDPSIAEGWDQINPEPSVSDYLNFIQTSVDALNYALEDLPQDKIRFHLCWGSWHGPHTTDLEFKHLAKTLLSINASAYSFEAANARHAHEWKEWEKIELPAGKVILPGVVSHSTNVVEHPELVAQRIEQFASVVGKENVIASTDCGLGGRIHPDIAWAKLRSLGEGAKIASERLF
ncbi:cobalamin-independent methionine synthase II family protein [Rothia amarae]|uniref:Cobalamin-independent methionine synthase II family protein n=1 Tax=Rothia amarae TaxID=169480 RepID=A0A7H2BJ46_9MICC|nr:cobalamin-independent methionine synthase II family protein [Rothia amarae]QNV39692.1 cobalamin-independent methionine synthase II family protein [Rothia amarae]